MADLVCSTNAAVAYDFLLQKGLRDYQAAAVIGNLQQESGLNPKAAGDVEAGRATSFGVAQWHENRWAELQRFAASQGRDVWALDTQLDFLWHELQTTENQAYRELLAAPTLEAATRVFQDRFERCAPAACKLNDRIAYAQSALYACPAVRPPPPRRSGTVAAVVGVVALAAFAGYGALSALGARKHGSGTVPDADYWDRI